MRALHVATPCELEWDAMPEAGLDRHCPTCARTVHDLSARTEREARALLVLSSGTRLCGRFRAEPDGSPVFRRAGSVAVAAGLSALVGCGAPTDAARVTVATTLELPTPNAAIAASVDPPALTSAAPAASSAPTDPDPDHDGILGADDACPTLPGVASGRQDQNGCPARVVVETMGVVVIPLIVFDKGSPRLDAASDAVLDEIVAVLGQNPAMTVLEISGHTSTDESAPDTLGDARAKAVIDGLVRRGVARGRLAQRSAGASEPIDSNATAAGRARNRRVTFRVVTTP